MGGLRGMRVEWRPTGCRLRAGVRGQGRRKQEIVNRGCLGWRGREVDKGVDGEGWWGGDGGVDGAPPEGR